MTNEEEYIARKIASNDAHMPGWRSAKHTNGRPMYNPENGMLLDPYGNRSIFDDVDD